MVCVAVCGRVWRDVAWCGLMGCGRVWRDVAFRGVPWRGVWHGVVLCVAWCGVMWRGVVECLVV